MEISYTATGFGYRLTLGDGTSWFIAADQGLEDWVDTLAGIMELKPGRDEGLSKIVFSEMSLKRESGRIKDSCCELNTLRMRYVENFRDVRCEVKRGCNRQDRVVSMWHSLAPIYYGSMAAGGLPVHAALIEHNGAGVLLAASGDTGKTTCCRRLPDDWRVHCDDETLVVCDGRMSYLAHPFPTWSHFLWDRDRRTWNVQHPVPVTALCFIEQSDADEAVSMGQGESAARLSQSALQVCDKFLKRLDVAAQRRRRRDIFAVAASMAKRIPAYRLRVSLTGRFWENIKAVLP